MVTGRALAVSLSILCVVVGAGFHAGCGGDNGNAGDGGGDGGAEGSPFGDSGQQCTSGSDCDGGACVNGMCCEAKQACGSTCCAGGTVCLFDSCVMPGKPCRSANDCAPGEYCEPALGDKDGGMPEAGCSQPPPPNGKCLPLPPVCPDGGTMLPDGGSCVAQCEYHPPSGGMLKAIPKWTWGPTATTFPTATDVWSTPTVGRIHDNNCDGKVDYLDSPNIVFVSGDAQGTCCQCNGTTPTNCHKGVLRMLDGLTGKEIWSLDKASVNSSGFSGLSIAIGDIDADGFIDIVAATGEGYVVMVDRDGKVVRTSNVPIPNAANNGSFGWGAGLAIADMDGDGHAEIGFGATVFTTTNNAITLKFTGAGGMGSPGGVDQAMSTFADLDLAGNNHLELLAGRTAYKDDGTILWNRGGLPDGFSGVGDFNKDGKPEAVLVSGGQLWILDGATGTTALGPVTMPGTGSGGPPTIADFDGDGKPEIGVAKANQYVVMKPNYAQTTINVLWSTPNHDLSSSVTGSTVFDFEGDGKAEVIYGDECFLWVFDGTTGAVRFAAPHSSFTATEASILADIDNDGHAEMLMVSNAADPSVNGWGCMNAQGNGVTVNGQTWKAGPVMNKGYKGLVLFGDVASSWVGTRTLWSEHTYHVSNICDDRDTACTMNNVYGAIPQLERTNWTVPWLNDFRQNVQDKGIFNAADGVLSLAVDCTSPLMAHVSVRNIGTASLPAGVDVGVFIAANDMQIAKVTTTISLFPGQTQTLDIALTGQMPVAFYARILIDPMNPKFHQCREDNDRSSNVTPQCNGAN